MNNLEYHINEAAETFDLNTIMTEKMFLDAVTKTLKKFSQFKFEKPKVDKQSIISSFPMYTTQVYGKMSKWSESAMSFTEQNVMLQISVTKQGNAKCTLHYHGMENGPFYKLNIIEPGTPVKKVKMLQQINASELVYCITDFLNQYEN